MNNQNECHFCLNQIVAGQEEEHMCDAMVGSIQQLKKLPSIPAQEQVHKIKSHTNPCCNYRICGQEKLENLEYCSTECHMMLIVMECIKANNYAQFRTKIENIVEPHYRNLNNMPHFDSEYIHTSKNLIQNLINDPLKQFSIFATPPFQNGEHRWRFYVEAETHMFLKIGVSTQIIDSTKCFSDFNTGFAYFTLGKLRHGSNSEGKEYGVKIKGKYTIDVLLNMDLGQLTFFVNDQFLGVAFTDPELQSQVYPAICVQSLANIHYEFLY